MSRVFPSCSSCELQHKSGKGETRLPEKGHNVNETALFRHPFTIVACVLRYEPGETIKIHHQCIRSHGLMLINLRFKLNRYQILLPPFDQFISSSSPPFDRFVAKLWLILVSFPCVVLIDFSAMLMKDWESLLMSLLWCFFSLLNPLLCEECMKNVLWKIWKICWMKKLCSFVFGGY